MLNLHEAVLALDIGTSSCRASLYDVQARPLEGRSAHVAYTPTVTADGGAELDPAVLLYAVASTIDQVLTATAATPRIAAVAVSTFWHSLIGLDANARPVTPVLLWLDARSRGEMEVLRRRLDERAVHARTGCVFHWSYWPAKLSWFKRTRPEDAARVKRWVSLGELVLERFTGARGVSVSMASGTGLLNAHRLQWDPEVLEALELDPVRLNPLVPLSAVSNSSQWPALAGVPWVPALGDGACSNVGAGCTTPDRFALMVGTSGAERAAWTPMEDFSVPWGAWCYRIDDRRAIIGGALNDGGSLLDWLRGALQLPDFEAADRTLAVMQPDSHGLTVLPFWGGERNPGWADDARGAIVGMRLHTQPIDILRACLEAVALRFAAIDNILHTALPDAADVIATGGALLHSSAWMQMIADALGRPVLASAEAEASSRGAALIALDALGLLDVPLDNMQPEVTRRFEPIAEHTARYRAALERQQRLYDALLR